MRCISSCVDRAVHINLNGINGKLDRWMFLLAINNAWRSVHLSDFMEKIIVHPHNHMQTASERDRAEMDSGWNGSLHCLNISPGSWQASSETINERINERNRFRDFLYTSTGRHMLYWMLLDGVHLGGRAKGRQNAFVIPLKMSLNATIEF